MMMIRINPLPTSPLAVSETTCLQDVVLHHAMNPVSHETSIIYPAAAELYFQAAGDLANVALSRRLLVENRISIALDVLLDRSLFDFVDELQNAWIDRRKPNAAFVSHQAEDYETVAGAFELAVRDAQEMSGAGPELSRRLELARSFRESTSTLETLLRWTVMAQSLLPGASLILLGARLLWQSGAFGGSILTLRETAALLSAERDGAELFAVCASWRKEGFLRYATALALLLKPDSEIAPLESAIEELKEAIACFHRSNGPFPSILYKRLAETHETLGRTHFEKDDMLSAGYHFGQARDFERFTESNRLPVARARIRRPSSRGWLAALRSLIGKG